MLSLSLSLSLSRSVMEFIAPQEYMVRPPQPPVYFFVIEVTYAAVISGLLQATVNAIKRAMSSLNADPRTQIGFLTFDHQLHFYNLKSSLSQPQMLVVPDVAAYTEGMFLPLPYDLLVNLRDSQHVVDALLDKLPAMFASTQHVDSALGPALKAASGVVVRGT